MKSPAEYMQAAFRAQNPYTFERDGQLVQKENAYVFDFDPTRTLTIFDEFANVLMAETSNGKGTAANPTGGTSNGAAGQNSPQTSDPNLAGKIAGGLTAIGVFAGGAYVFVKNNTLDKIKKFVNKEVTK